MKQTSGGCKSRTFDLSHRPEPSPISIRKDDKDVLPDQIHQPAVSVDKTELSWFVRYTVTRRAESREKETAHGKKKTGDRSSPLPVDAVYRGTETEKNERAEAECSPDGDAPTARSRPPARAARPHPGAQAPAAPRNRRRPVDLAGEAGRGGAGRRRRGGARAAGRRGAVGTTVSGTGRA